MTSDVWEVRPLGSTLLRRPRYGINAPANPSGGGGKPYIRITDIDDDGRFRPSPRVEVLHPNSALYLLQPGDVVFARTGASVGKSYRYDPADGELVFAGFLINITPNPEILDPSYLATYVHTAAYWNWVAATSVRSGQPGINGREYALMPLPVPPIEVQRAISAAIADSEHDIDVIERLSSKKQAIKQGMAQELLSGRTRLPGFDREWSEVRLGDVGSTYGGLTGKTKTDFGSGSGRYVTFLDVINHVQIQGDALEHVRVGTSERQNQVARGDVLFNGSSETPEEVALGGAIDFDPAPGTYINSFCFGYRVARKDLVDPIYLAHLMRSGVGRRLVFALAQGATRYNISKRRFLALAPAFPPRDEQIAIVAVLTDVDAEINLLKKRLEKAKAVKQGMAQQLLTGKTRLPVLEAVA